MLAASVIGLKSYSDGCRYTLVTPLVNKEWNRGVLINRGWVPAEWRSNSKLRSVGCPTGQVLPFASVWSIHHRKQFHSIS